MKITLAFDNTGAETPGIQAATHLIVSGAPLLPQPAIDVAITDTSLVGEIGGYDHMVEFISVASTIENGDLAIDLLDRSNPARLKMIFVRGRKSFDVVSASTALLTPLW